MQAMALRGRTGICRLGAVAARPAMRASTSSHAHVFVAALASARSTLAGQGQRSSPSACVPGVLQLRGFSSAAGSEVAQLPDSIQRMLSLDNACQMEKNHHAIRQAIAEYQRHPGDTGSSEVQIAILTEKIKYMTAHVQVHRKDQHNNRGLVQMVQDRRKLLKYLKRDDVERYTTLIEKLGIRDAINLLPQRAFLPAKAAEAAIQRERQRTQMAEQGRKKLVQAEALRDSFAGKREEKQARQAAKEAAAAAAAAAANAETAN